MLSGRRREMRASVDCDSMNQITRKCQRLATRTPSLPLFPIDNDGAGTRMYDLAGSIQLSPPITARGCNDLCTPL